MGYHANMLYICAIWIKKCLCYSMYTLVTLLRIMSKNMVKSGNIKSMASLENWPEIDKEPPLLPLYNAKPRRPNMLRRRGPLDVSKDLPQLSKDETHLNMSLFQLHCIKCKKSCYNSRKCVGDTIARERMVHFVN